MGSQIFGFPQLKYNMSFLKVLVEENSGLQKSTLFLCLISSQYEVTISYIIYIL